MSDIATSETTIIRVPVTKSKSFVDIDTGRVSNEIYAEAVTQGFKVLVNGGAHKITPKDIPDEATRFAEAQALAEKRVEEMYSGKLAVRAAKAAKKSGVDAKTITEARRIARDMVKAAIKSRGQKITGYTPSEITALANELIADGVPGADAIIAQAEKNLAVRGTVPVVSIDVPLKSDEKAAAKAKEVKTKAKEASGLSAKQAGMTAHHSTHGAH